MTSHGSARKANTARPYIYKTGSHSGLMKKNVCRRQSIFSLSVYSKLKNSGRGCGCIGLKTILDRARTGMENAQDHTSLMLQEAQLTKSLYKLTSQTVGYGSFTRAKRGGGADMANRFLDQGNYLAYGLAAVAAWVTGIPHGLAVMHGKTRRGGLVFDIADLIKDALVMPQAFVAAMEGEDSQQFRQRCINAFQQSDALDVMITTLQDTSQSLAGVAQ